MPADVDMLQWYAYCKLDHANNSLGAIAARKVKRMGTSQGMTVSITMTWLMQQVALHLGCATGREQKILGSALAIHAIVLCLI